MPLDFGEDGDVELDSSMSLGRSCRDSGLGNTSETGQGALLDGVSSVNIFVNTVHSACILFMTIVFVNTVIRLR